jgi:hypothetical protein
MKQTESHPVSHAYAIDSWWWWHYARAEVDTAG